MFKVSVALKGIWLTAKSYSTGFSKGVDCCQNPNLNAYLGRPITRQHWHPRRCSHFYPKERYQYVPNPLESWLCNRIILRPIRGHILTLKQLKWQDWRTEPTRL
jgi:hypothetical protein